MDNNENKKTLGDALESMEEMNHVVGDHMKAALKPIKQQARAVQEAIKSSRNPHVQELTVGQYHMNRGLKVRTTPAARHSREWLLRRMWAINLLHCMKAEGFNWEGIQKLTGKSRQTWYNVTGSGFVPKEILDLDFDNGKRKRHIERESYRPVTNGFIRSVTESIESRGYSVFTKYFRLVWEVGYTVWEPDGLMTVATISRIGHRLGQTEGRDFVDNSSTANASWMAAIEGHDGKVVEHPLFPLLWTNVRDSGEVECYLSHVDLEIKAYGYEDEKTRKPNKKATNALAEWNRYQIHHDEQFPSEPLPESTKQFKGSDDESSGDYSQVNPNDPLTWHNIPKEPEPQPLRLNPTKPIIQADDGKPQEGWFHIFKKPIELHPNMADANGQIKLTVVVQLDKDGNKTNVVTTDNKGFFHFS